MLLVADVRRRYELEGFAFCIFRHDPETLVLVGNSEVVAVHQIRGQFLEPVVGEGDCHDRIAPERGDNGVGFRHCDVGDEAATRPLFFHAIDRIVCRFVGVES